MLFFNNQKVHSSVVDIIYKVSLSVSGFSSSRVLISNIAKYFIQDCMPVDNPGQDQFITGQLHMSITILKLYKNGWLLVFIAFLLARKNLQTAVGSDFISITKCSHKIYCPDLRSIIKINEDSFGGDVPYTASFDYYMNDSQLLVFSTILHDHI